MPCVGWHRSDQRSTAQTGRDTIGDWERGLHCTQLPDGCSHGRHHAAIGTQPYGLHTQVKAESSTATTALPLLWLGTDRTSDNKWRWIMSDLRFCASFLRFFSYTSRKSDLNPDKVKFVRSGLPQKVAIHAAGRIEALCAPPLRTCK